MAQLLALVGRILSVVLDLLGITTSIRSLLGNPAQQPTLDTVATQVANIQTLLLTSGTSLPALLDAINAIRGEGMHDLTEVLNAIADVQQAANPVVLPDTPPTGYGGNTTDAISSSVWGFQDTNSGKLMGDLMADIGAAAWNQTAIEGYTHQRDPHFSMRAPGIIWSQVLDGVEAIAADWNDILPGETLGEWLVRTAGEWPWALDEDSGLYYADYETGPGSRGWIIQCNLSEPEFALLSGAAKRAVAPPVWPGLDAVTLLEPVDLAAGVTITADMDGVLVAITEAPTKQGYFTFDDVRSYRNIGALAFVSDNGDEEFPQTLGFVNAVYCPRAMIRAAGVKVRAADGVVGTVTPWITTEV